MVSASPVLIVSLPPTIVTLLLLPTPMLPPSSVTRSAEPVTLIAEVAPPEMASLLPVTLTLLPASATTTPLLIDTPLPYRSHARSFAAR